MTENDDLSKRVCRVAVVGAQRIRVAKVVSLLTRVPEHNDIESTLIPVYREISIQYLPCVANFGSYENESGETIKYLASVEYHGSEGKNLKGSSIAPFFDADDSIKDEESSITSNKKLPFFPGVSVIAIGCGIDSEDDVKRIETFVNALSGSQIDSNKRPKQIECIAPNTDYISMKEENEAYKALDTEGKAEATRLQTIGPGKMAKFASSLAQRAIETAYGDIVEVEKNASVQEQQEMTLDEPAIKENGIPKKEDTSTELEIPHAEPPRVVDPGKTRYACRRCRTILFGENDLEDPPHTPSRHNFSMAKVHHAGGNSVQRCQSIFLGTASDWMGDMNEAEGKFSCPKCSTKLGHYSWSGAQCSCGTWVVPAIQVPASKVDIIAPFR